MRNRLYILIMFCLIALPTSCNCNQHKEEIKEPFDFDIGLIPGIKYQFREPCGRRWSAFTDASYGSAGDIWVSFSGNDGRSWRRPLFTGITTDPATGIPDFSFEVKGEKLHFNYRPVSISEDEEQKLSVTVTLDELLKDSDSDGLLDMVEARLTTDPHNPDTSGDGIADGEDMNPLVYTKEYDKMSDIEKIRTKALTATMRKTQRVSPGEMVLVQLPDRERQAFSGHSGIVLCMEKSDISAFRKELGQEIFDIGRTGRLTSYGVCVIYFQPEVPEVTGDTATVEVQIFRDSLNGEAWGISLLKKGGDWEIKDIQQTAIW